MEPIDLTQTDLAPVPEPWDALHLNGMLITPSLIQQRVRELALEIERRFPQNESICVVSLLSGAFLFTADLVRHWKNPIELDFMGVSSYRKNTASGNLSWTHPLQVNLRNKHVLILDDILDTGQTLREVKSKLEDFHPTTVHSCVLLEKVGKQGSEVAISADFVGFRIPNHFVVGYGLDFALKFRQLPFIGVVKTSNE